MRAAQTILQNKYKGIAVDGTLGPQTLRAMNKFANELADRARKATDVPIESSEESQNPVNTSGAGDLLSPLART